MSIQSRSVLLAAVLGWTAVTASAEGPLVTVGSDVGYPLSPSGLYQAAVGGSGNLRFPGASQSPEAGLRVGYTGLLLPDSVAGLSVGSLEAAGAWPFWAGPGASTGPTLAVGVYGAFREGSSPLWNPLAAVGWRTELKLPGVWLGLEPEARALFARQGASVGTLSLTAGLRFTLTLTGGPAAARQPHLQWGVPQIEPVFPTIYKWYASNPMGKITLTNREPQKITEVEVSMNVPSCMDGAQVVGKVSLLEPGQSTEVALTPILRNAVLGITETDTAQVQFRVRYVVEGQTVEGTTDSKLTLLGRNAITWSDDRVAAAFVTAKDPTILKLARTTVAALPAGGVAVPTEAIRQAMGLFQALEADRLKYVIDPKGSYATMKGKSSAVDFLQFPVETLAYRTGDCDDLSTLYLSLLEAVGLETAFVTVPGHIYSAVALAETPAQLKSLYSDVDRFVFTAGKAWLPVETTALGQGFDQAWALGAREWLDADRTGAARLIPVHAAWAVYEPTFVSSEERQEVVAKFPDPADVADQYTGAMTALATRELTALTAALLGGQPASALPPTGKNKLGVLYARYGKLDQSTGYFQQAAAAGWPSAQVNLGNLAYLKQDYAEATRQYRAALKSQPGNLDALVGIARSQFELGQATDALASYTKVKAAAPDRAEAIAYIGGAAADGTGRAADIRTRNQVEWSR